MRRFFALALLAALAASCGSSARGPGAAPGRPDPAADALRGALTPLYEQGVLQGGMVIALVDPARDGGVAYLSFGGASAEGAAPPGPDAIFEIGSISKVLTALLLAELAVAGEVSLETPVARLLPFGVRFPDKDGAVATLEHLATHRAGLPAVPGNLSPATSEDPYATYGRQQLHAYLERAELLFAPGRAYAYSSLGAGLLGHVLAGRLGVSYEAAVRTRVLAPLGLTETWIEVPAAARPRQLPGTTASGEPAAPWRFDVLAGAGAWRSTPRDLAALLGHCAAAAAGGEGPLAEALRLAMTPIGTAGPDMEIALGWHVTDAGVLWHNGQTGGFASFAGLDPATGRGVVILASTASPLVTRIGMGTFDVLAGGTLELDLRLVTVPAAQLDRLVGTYRLASGEELEVVREEDRLLLVMGDERVRLFSRSPSEFLLMEVEASVRFVFEDDRVAGFVLHLPGGELAAQRVR
jgi:serine-type D-Ala-D-Ala carboxypeptidase/endopeptidase